MPRLVMFAIVAALSACADGDASGREDEPPDVVGTWIRVYPPLGALDTMVLRADGSVSGSTAGLMAFDFPYQRWRIGSPYMPGGFCIGEAEGRLGQEPRFYCSGFLLRADTLWLANSRRTVFVRAAVDGRRRDVTPWASPGRGVDAPQPAESVRAAGTQRNR